MVMQGKTKQTYCGQRVEFAGVMNFRDLGGIQSKDGRKIKRGILFRSADLSDLTALDINQIKDIGIKTIFDYRTASEANQRPSLQIEGVNYLRVSVNRETDTPTFTSLEEYIQSEPIDSFGNEFLMKLYESIPLGNPSYQQLMELLKKPDVHLPLVHHCAGGRDRTGVGTMIILLTLGVDWETIVEDFLFSNVMLQDYHEEIFSEVKKIVPEEQANQFKDQFLLQERYLKSSYQNILDHYGSVDNFLEEEYEITYDVRQKIQDYCLQK